MVSVIVIQSFADQTTADIYHGKDTKAARKIDKAVWPAIQRKMEYLDKAKNLRDLGIVPGTRLHPLKGEQKGRLAIRVNDQYRITFRAEQVARKAFLGKPLPPEFEAHEVCCEDYH